jgi:hypothetical protein
MKKTLIYSFAIVLALGFLASCSSAYKSINTGGVANIELERIKPDRYVILDEVEGYGTAAGLGSGSSILAQGVNARLEKAKRNAEYQAISKVEGADMLLAPRYEIESFSIPMLFSSYKVKVKAKAVRIKSTNEK